MIECLPVTTPIRATQPTFEQEPLTLEEARRQVAVGVENTYHDPDLKDLIVAARQRVEGDTGLVCYTGSFAWKQTAFPCESWLAIPGIRPVTAVTSITYVDTAGVTQTWNSSYYSLETGTVTPCIRLVYGQSWPTVRGDMNGITITAAAGHASVAVIPSQIKVAVKLALSLLWAQKMGEVAEAEKLQGAYDRWIVGPGLMRSSYP